MSKDYGTNNFSALTDICEESPTEKHIWIETDYRKCLSVNKCKYCNSIHKIDSSD